MMENNLTAYIRNSLYELSDPEYREFQSGLIPNVGKEIFIGVRTPALRGLARELRKEADIYVFLDDLPHEYFDEYQLHDFLLDKEKPFDKCIEEVEKFLPYVNNWATCDQLSPEVFKKNREKLLPYIQKWIGSDHVYTVRFGIGMLMSHFLDDLFDPGYLEWVSSVRSEEYYINMMIAWYFATALAKQYDAALPYIENKRLSVWVHNKTIQKAVESYRIPDDHKEYLRSLRIRKG